MPRAAKAPDAQPHPSGHVFDETEGRCLRCGWHFRMHNVATGGGHTLPLPQYRQTERDPWTSVRQNLNLPPQWPRCPAVDQAAPAAPVPLEDLE